MLSEYDFLIRVLEWIIIVNFNIKKKKKRLIRKVIAYVQILCLST